MKQNAAYAILPFLAPARHGLGNTVHRRVEDLIVWKPCIFWLPTTNFTNTGQMLNYFKTRSTEIWPKFVYRVGMSKREILVARICYTRTRTTTTHQWRHHFLNTLRGNPLTQWWRFAQIVSVIWGYAPFLQWRQLASSLHAYIEEQFPTTLWRNVSNTRGIMGHNKLCWRRQWVKINFHQ